MAYLVVYYGLIYDSIITIKHAYIDDLAEKNTM